jgi:hypothetical protein
MQIEARYYETYELCDIVDQVLRDPYEHAGGLAGFTCDDGWVGLTEPFEQYSALHRFVEFVVRNVHHEQIESFDLAERQRSVDLLKDIPESLRDMQLTTLPIELAFGAYEIAHENFVEHLASIEKTFASASEDDLYHFVQDTFLTEAYDRLLDQTVKEVFHIVFQNRGLLLSFNDYVSRIVARAKLDQIAELPRSRFETNGTLRRRRPPQWAQRAVFFRDRGRCVLCDKDLSGLTNLSNIKNYDHMVPLARFGLNDVSNLQLLCAECNKASKSAGPAVTASTYQTWYSYDD